MDEFLKVHYFLFLVMYIVFINHLILVLEIFYV